MIERQEFTAFPMKLLGSETLYVPAGTDGRPYVFDAIRKLDCEGKTVVITDSYLFDSAGDSTYQDFVREVLLALKASKIIYTSYAGNGHRAIRNAVIPVIQAQGCTVEYRPAQIHHRYWFCLESNKAIDMPSINSIGKRSSSITYIDENDKKDLKADLIAQGVISND